MRKKVLVPIANGSEELEIVGIVDTLRRAGAEVTVASVQDLEITASRMVKLVADKLIRECADEDYDLIALPGGLPGAEYLRDSPILTELLISQVEKGKLYAAICASPVVILQYHNLLKNKKATAHPALSDQLKDQSEVDQRVIVDGNCITSRGPGTVLEFAIKLVELLYDREKALKVSGPMLIK